MGARESKNISLRQENGLNRKEPQQNQINKERELIEKIPHLEISVKKPSDYCEGESEIQKPPESGQIDQFILTQERQSGRKMNGSTQKAMFNVQKNLFRQIFEEEYELMTIIENDSTPINEWPGESFESDEDEEIPQAQNKRNSNDQQANQNQEQGESSKLTKLVSEGDYNEDEDEDSDTDEEDLFNLPDIIYEKQTGDPIRQNVAGLDQNNGQSYLVKQYGPELSKELVLNTELAKKVWKLQRKNNCFCIMRAINIDDDGRISLVQIQEKGGCLTWFLDTPFLEKDAKIWIIKILQALALLHDNDIIHGNIKPNNILIGEGGLKLADIYLFNNYKYLHNLYSAPELLLNDKLCQQSDIWSVGLIFIEMLSGTMPFLQKNPQLTVPELKKKIGRVKLVFPFSQETKEFISMMIQLKPENRKSAADLLKSKYLRLGGEGDQELQKQLSLSIEHKSISVRKPTINRNFDISRLNTMNNTAMVEKSVLKSTKYGLTSMASYISVVNVKEKDYQQQESYLPTSVANLMLTTQMTSNHLNPLNHDRPSHRNDTRVIQSKITEILKKSVSIQENGPKSHSYALPISHDDDYKNMQSLKDEFQQQNSSKIIDHGKKQQIQNDDSVDAKNKKKLEIEDQLKAILNQQVSGEASFSLEDFKGSKSRTLKTSGSKNQSESKFSLNNNQQQGLLNTGSQGKKQYKTFSDNVFDNWQKSQKLEESSQTSVVQVVIKDKDQHNGLDNTNNNDESEMQSASHNYQASNKSRTNSNISNNTNGKNNNNSEKGKINQQQYYKQDDQLSDLKNKLKTINNQFNNNNNPNNNTNNNKNSNKQNNLVINRNQPNQNNNTINNNNQEYDFVRGKEKKSGTCLSEVPLVYSNNSQMRFNKQTTNANKQKAILDEMEKILADNNAPINVSNINKEKTILDEMEKILGANINSQQSQVQSSFINMQGKGDESHIGQIQENCTFSNIEAVTDMKVQNNGINAKTQNYNVQIPEKSDSVYLGKNTIVAKGDFITQTDMIFRRNDSLYFTPNNVNANNNNAKKRDSRRDTLLIGKSDNMIGKSGNLMRQYDDFIDQHYHKHEKKSSSSSDSSSSKSNDDAILEEMHSSVRNIGEEYNQETDHKIDNLKYKVKTHHRASNSFTNTNYNNLNSIGNLSVNKNQTRPTLSSRSNAATTQVSNLIQSDKTQNEDSNAFEFNKIEQQQQMNKITSDQKRNQFTHKNSPQHTKQMTADFHHLTFEIQDNNQPRSQNTVTQHSKFSIQQMTDEMSEQKGGSQQTQGIQDKQDRMSNQLEYLLNQQHRGSIQTASFFQKQKQDSMPTLNASGSFHMQKVSVTQIDPVVLDGSQDSQENNCNYDLTSLPSPPRIIQQQPKKKNNN